MGTTATVFPRASVHELDMRVENYDCGTTVRPGVDPSSGRARRPVDALDERRHVDERVTVAPGGRDDLVT